MGLMALSAPTHARAENCPAIRARLDENAICDPAMAKTKECDAKYRAPSKEWVACYDETFACRRRIFDQNKQISNYNSMVYKCRASVITGLLNNKDKVIAHTPGTVPALMQPVGQHMLGYSGRDDVLLEKQSERNDRIRSKPTGPFLP
jgi:hypothetical protein